MFESFEIFVDIKFNNFIQSGWLALSTLAKYYSSPLLHSFVEFAHFKHDIFIGGLSFAPDESFIKILNNLVIVLNHWEKWSWFFTLEFFTNYFCSKFFEDLQSGLIELRLLSKAQSITFCFILNSILHLLPSEVYKTAGNRNLLPDIHHLMDEYLQNFYCQCRLCINKLVWQSAEDCTVILRTRR